MSVEAGNLTHFINTLSKNPKTISDDYLPRHFFGNYLKKTFELSLKLAQKYNINVHVIKEKVVDLKVKNNTIHLAIEKRPKIKVDYAILCLGNVPSNHYLKFLKIKNYIHSPYAKDLTKKIPQNEDVIILGSSLTAVDAALTLQKNAHRGKIIFISRSGFLPKVQGKSHNYELKFITLKSIKRLSKNFTTEIGIATIFNLFKKELETAFREKIDWKKVFQKPISTKNELVQDIKNSLNHNLLWQSILLATARISPFIWHNIKESDRIEFMKKYYSIWCSYRHSMPLINAEKILKIMQNNQLNVLGGIKNVTYSRKDKKFTAQYSTEDKGDERIFAKYLINAIGAGYSLYKTQSVLLKNLFKNGIVKENLCGGIDVDFNTFNIISQNGKSQKNIYSVGPLTRGVHFYTNAIEMNALHAEKIAESIIFKLSR